MLGSGNEESVFEPLPRDGGGALGATLDTFLATNANLCAMAHIRQSRPDSSLGFQMEARKPFPSLLGSGLPRERDSRLGTVYRGASLIRNRHPVGAAPSRPSSPPRVLLPMSSECGTFQTVEARSWLGREPGFKKKSSTSCKRLPFRSAARSTRCSPPTVHHQGVDARQSRKSIPRIHRGIDVKRHFPLPLTQSMAPTAEPNCSLINLGWHLLSSEEKQLERS